MTMEVRDCPEYLVNGQNVELIYRGVLHYIEALETLKKWLDSNDTTKTAIANIQEEINFYRRFSVDIYDKCYSKNIKGNIPYTWTP